MMTTAIHQTSGYLNHACIMYCGTPTHKERQSSSSAVASVNFTTAASGTVLINGRWVVSWSV
jgi:hypothetical protein